MSNRKHRLPPKALLYIEYRKQLQLHPTTIIHDRMILRDLHQWLDQENLQYNELTRHDIHSFDKYLISTHATRFTIRYHDKIRIANYFRWLHQNGYFDGSVDQIFGLRAHRKLNVDLPIDAKKYLTFVKTHKKTSMCEAASISHFYKFLRINKISLKKITRLQIEKFLEYLKDNGGGITHRITVIYLVRQYLAWLLEHGKFDQDPYFLIRAKDIPKKPKFLPRPLPPPIDREIQDRLTQASTVHHLGLLLMRKTGLRIGELHSLDYECVRTDFNSNSFLKVPLGKLNTERMVPLDETCLILIKEIKNQIGKNTNFKPLHLMTDSDGTRIPKSSLHCIFKDISYDIESNEPITAHRLRHSFASELLNAGVSLICLKELLGHKNITMTLRYASITQQTVQSEYFGALGRLKNKYEFPEIPKPDGNLLDPLQTISDLLRILPKWQDQALKSNKREIASIQRKLKSIAKQIQSLI